MYENTGTHIFNIWYPWVIWCPDQVSTITRLSYRWYLFYSSLYRKSRCIPILCKISRRPPCPVGWVKWSCSNWYPAVLHYPSYGMEPTFSGRSIIYIVKLYIHLHHILHKPLKNWMSYSLPLWMQGGGGCRRKITGHMKWSPEYEKAMDIVELWLLLKTQYKEHHYIGHWLTQINWPFAHVTSDIYEVSITLVILSAFSRSKTTKNYADLWASNAVPISMMPFKRQAKVYQPCTARFEN